MATMPLWFQSMNFQYLIYIIGSHIEHLVLTFVKVDTIATVTVFAIMNILMI